MSIIDKYFNSTFTGLQKSMDLALRRNEAIVSNISNAETPQYRAVDLNFAGELDKAFGANNSAITKTNTKHIDLTSNSQAHLTADLSGATKPDGNNVDLDIQMGQLAHNAGQYSMATSLYRKKLSMLKNAIRDSRS